MRTLRYWVYVGPQHDEHHAHDCAVMGEHSALCYTVDPAGADCNAVTPTKLVRLLTNEACCGLVLPDDLRRHTAQIEQVKGCAHLLGMRVMPLTRFVYEMKPAAVAAVPANQQPAVVGHPTTHL